MSLRISKRDKINYAVETDACEDTYHDFINYRKWLKYATGHQILGTTKNRIYIGALFIMLGYFLIMSIVAMIISVKDTIMFFHSVHTFLLVVMPLGTLLNRSINDGVLTGTTEALKSGVFKYVDDLIDEEHNQIKMKTVKQIKYISKLFSNSLLVGVVAQSVLPLLEFLVNDEDSSEKPMNPYLPQPFYMPFNSWTILGYCVAYVLNVVYMIYLCLLVSCTDELFVSITLQFKAQLQILNHSLLNIENRAYWKTYKKKLTENVKHFEDLYAYPEFQRSMYMCLRSNVQHHQALFRLKKSFEKYSNKSFLLIFTLASLVMAGMVILIMESPGLLYILPLASALLPEMLFTFHFCWYSEQVAEESGKLFSTLYAVPWHKCDKPFNVLLSVMMGKAKTPIILETAYFRITASLETFGNIITRMYQIMSAARRLF